MSPRLVFVVVFLLFTAALSSQKFRDLAPREPSLELESDGGRLESWGRGGSDVFEDANVAACRVVLKPRGLWLPAYIDSPSLKLVTRGRGRVGIVAPQSDRRFQENTFKVVEGDVVAVPEGHVVWWYNDEDEDLEIVGVADVSSDYSRSADAGVRAFHLVGGNEGQQQGYEEDEAGYAGLIHGFSKGVLARAWKMEKESVREILESQNGAGIVRLEREITFEDDENKSNIFFENFIYRLAKVHPDLRVENGGEVRELSSSKHPILKFVGFGLECVQLEQDAMISPNWFINAHQVLYVVSGRGRVEAVDNHGERVLDAELEEGSLVVIPAFFPSTKIASRDERFHYMSFITSDRPVMSFISGRRSVYRGIPARVLARMLNVDEEQARQVQKAHEKESIILRSRERRESTM